MVKHYYQKQCKKKRIYFPYSQIWGKKKKGVKAGTWRSKLKQKTSEHAVYGDVQSNFIKPPRATFPWLSWHRVVLVFPYQF